MNDQLVIDIFLLMLVMSAFCSVLVVGVVITYAIRYLHKKLAGRNSDPYRSQRP